MLLKIKTRPSPPAKATSPPLLLLRFFSHHLLPPPEWIQPYINISDLSSSSLTPNPKTPSPFLLRILSLLTTSSTPEPDLKSFCTSFLILLSPHFISAAISHPSLSSHPLSATALFHFASSQPSFTHSLSSYLSILRLLSSSPHSSPHSSARLIASQLAARHDLLLTPSSANSLLQSLAALGLVQELLWAWRRMKECGVEPQLTSYNCLMDGLINASFVESAEKVFEVLDSGVNNNVYPDVVSYNILIKGFMKVGRTDKAMGRFREMKRKGLDPDKITYLTLIQCHYGDGSLGDCLVLYHEMEEKEIEIPPHAYSLVISGLCRENRPFDALMVFDRMAQRGCCSANVAVYTALIDSFAKIGNEEKAMGLLERMKGDGFEPDEVTYGALVNCFSKGGKLDKAMEWFELCKVRGMMVNTILYSTLIDGFGKAGRVEEAEKLFDEMRDDGFVPDTYCYNALIDSFLKTGRIDDARALFERMEKEGCDQTVYTFTIMMDGLFKKHKNEEALKLWARMIDKGVTPTPASFRVLSSGLCLSGKFDRAMRILDELAPMGIVPETAHEDMIRVLCKAGRIEHACKLADEIVEKGREIPGKVRTMMINSLRKAGNADFAIKLVHSRIGIGYDRVKSIKRRVKFITLINI